MQPVTNAEHFKQSSKQVANRNRGRPHNPQSHLPKVAKKKDVMKIDSIVGDVERQKQIEEGSISFVLIGTEVPEAVFNLHKMAKIPRVDAITWGAEDLSGALGAKAKRDSEGNYLEVFSYVRSACLLAAVAGDANPIDAVYVDIKNTDVYHCSLVF